MSIKSYRTAVTEQSATATDLGKIGERREEEEGKVYYLVKAGEQINAYQCVEVSAYDAATNEITIAKASATLQVAGVNSLGNASVISGNYFWMQVAGVVTCFANANGTTIGLPVIQKTTDGWIEDYGAADVTGPIGVALETADSDTAAVLLQLG